MRQEQKEDIIFNKTADVDFHTRIVDAIPIISSLAAMLFVVPLGLPGLLALLALPVQQELQALLEILAQLDLQVPPGLQVLPALQALLGLAQLGPPALQALLVIPE
jgi:hypothetical protein